MYVNGDTDILVAQAAYTVPAPAPVVATPAPVATVRDYDCRDFRYQQDAQVHLLAGDPYRLDADHDGIACEELPSRPTYTAPAPTGRQPALALDYAEAVQVSGARWPESSAGRGRTAVAASSRVRRDSAPPRWAVGAAGSGVASGYRASVTVHEYSTTYGTSTRLTSKRRA